MNCNPDRTPVTVEQLEALARRAGVSEEDMAIQRGINEKAAFWRSFLEGVTRQLRFDMAMRGELVTDTSAPFVAKPRRAINIDPFFLAQRS